MCVLRERRKKERHNDASNFVRTQRVSKFFFLFSKSRSEREREKKGKLGGILRACQRRKEQRGKTVKNPFTISISHLEALDSATFILATWRKKKDFFLPPIKPELMKPFKISFIASSISFFSHSRFFSDP